MKKFLASADDVFRKIVEEASGFAVILLDPEGRIELWNDGAATIFGYRSDEVIGRNFEFLFVPADRQTGRPAEELMLARERGRGEDTRWHLRRDGEAVFVDGLTTPLWEGDRLIGYSKFARDVTDRHRAENRLAAQLALTNVLSGERPFDVTARAVMRTICENLGWDIGALWEVRDDAMYCVDHWRAPYVDEQAARALSEGHRFERGVGLLGEAWDSGEAVWASDFSDTARYPRAPLAEKAGMHAAFAFPIITAGRVAGALEFFSGTQREPDQALLPVMSLIGAQIGDFIERRRTHEALRESEERFRLMTETAQDAIFTIDENSVVTFSNRAAERLFGFAPEELIGHSLEVIIPERLREAHRRGIERFLRTRKRAIPWTGVELPALHKDGHEFACEIAFGEWSSEGKTIFTGFARDVTERNRVREELQRSLELEKQARAEAETARGQLERRAEEEASFRHLASALSGAVEMSEVLYEITNRATLVTRADGVYVERILEQGTRRVVEVVSSSGRGAPPRGLRVAYPGSMTDEIMSEASPVILADMREFGQHMAPYLADTCPKCEVLVTPLLAEDEALGSLVLLNSGSSGRQFRDSDVVRARTLGDLTSLALRRVRLMEQEREAKERAEAAVRVRDETLGIVSHDLRNPLTKIALSADLLVGSGTADEAELVETIRSSARQMDRLIQDLLDVARMETGHLSVAQEALETESLVREACDSHSRLAQQKSQTITCHISPPLPQICGDRDRLTQVFGNLLGNAIKFTPEHGTVSVYAKSGENNVTFVVRDTGSGIPEADLRNVFTPYWQAKKTAHMGAGLGLAIVRGIVEAHNGTVWAENAPGGGAMFTFTIPVVAPS